MKADRPAIPLHSLRGAGYPAVIGLGLLSLVAPFSEEAAEDTALICEGVFGCYGGELKCAEFRFFEGGLFFSGTCYDNIQPE